MWSTLWEIDIDEYDDDVVSRTDMEQDYSLYRTNISYKGEQSQQQWYHEAYGVDRLQHAINNNTLKVKYSSEAENVENKLLALSNRTYIGIIGINYS